MEEMVIYRIFGSSSPEIKMAYSKHIIPYNISMENSRGSY